MHLQKYGNIPLISDVALANVEFVDAHLAVSADFPFELVNLF